MCVCFVCWVVLYCCLFSFLSVFFNIFFLLLFFFYVYLLFTRLDLYVTGHGLSSSVLIDLHLLDFRSQSAVLNESHLKINNRNEKVK